MIDAIHEVALVAVIVLFVMFIIVRHAYEPALDLMARYSDWARRQLDAVHERERLHALKILGISNGEGPAPGDKRTSTNEKPRAVIKDLVARYARRLPDGKQPVGLVKQTWLKWYVDLKDPMTDTTTRKLLAHAIAIHIREVQHVRLKDGPLVFSKLAIPEPGNQVLGMTVAEELGIQWVVVKSEYRRINQYDIFDGTLKPGEGVIILDDVITSGAMIRETVSILRNAGANVQAVFGAVSRRDPSDWPELADLIPSVEVYPILPLSDTDIAEIVADHS